MFEDVNLEQQLNLFRNAAAKEEKLLSEANRILQEDLFVEEKILDNLREYNKAFEKLDEEDVDKGLVFSISEIKKVAVTFRLKFLESKLYKPEIPYEAILKIKDLNQKFHKELKFFKVLSTPGGFTNKEIKEASLLFVQTNYDNYYLVHRWGGKLKWNRKLKFWPLRKFENLILTVFVTTLLLTLALPTELITLDPRAVYWSGYRAAAFFHLFIFNMGVTVYFTFAFARNFSNSVWDSYRDFS